MAKQIRKKWVILWTGPALDDLREIRRYVARDKPQAARALAERIRDSVSKLRDYPNSGRVLPEFGELALRELIATPYRIVYERRENEVVILRVWHGRRDLPPGSLSQVP